MDHCRELLEFTTHVHITLLAMKLLSMPDISSTPQGAPATTSELKDFFVSISKKIVETVFLNYNVSPMKQKPGNSTLRFPCGFGDCPKTYSIDGMNLKKHREKCPFKDTTDPGHSQVGHTLYYYSLEFLTAYNTLH